MLNLTDYQKKQITALKLEGDFIYRNEAGNKAPRKAWQQMISALVKNGLIDRNCHLTAKGNQVADEIHSEWMKGSK